MLIKCWRFFSI